jgi:hybrid cluster-associated redox disulfide protein
MAQQERSMAEMSITKEMPIGDVVRSYPQTVPVFMQHGLHCIGCAVAAFESIEEGAVAHGIDIDALIKDLNDVAKPDKSEESA